MKTSPSPLPLMSVWSASHYSRGTPASAHAVSGRALTHQRRGPRGERRKPRPRGGKEEKKKQKKKNKKKTKTKKTNPPPAPPPAFWAAPLPPPGGPTKKTKKTARHG